MRFSPCGGCEGVDVLQMFEVMKSHNNITNYYILLHIFKKVETFLDPTYVNISDAVKFGDMETIKVAINNGIPVNQRDKYYKTPLMIACLYGKIDVAQALLDMG